MTAPVHQHADGAADRRQHLVDGRGCGALLLHDRPECRDVLVPDLCPIVRDGALQEGRGRPAECLLHRAAP